jgi:hypothetical protein
MLSIKNFNLFVDVLFSVGHGILAATECTFIFVFIFYLSVCLFGILTVTVIEYAFFSFYS